MVRIESASAHHKAFVRSRMSVTVVLKCPTHLCSHQKCHENTLITLFFWFSASLNSPALMAPLPSTRARLVAFLSSPVNLPGVPWLHSAVLNLGWGWCHPCPSDCPCPWLSQIDFLNSVIVDLQRRNEELNLKIQRMCEAALNGNEEEINNYDRYKS